MKALITGVSGFVGGYLCEQLLQNDYEVFGTKLEQEAVPAFLPRIPIMDVNLLNKEDVKLVINEYKPDVIFHLAAQSSVGLSWKNPNLTFDVNVKGTIQLLDEIRDSNKNCRLLLIGSSEEYGKVQPHETPINEQQPLRPGNPYAASKISQEYIAKVYADAYQLDIIMVRAFNHTGPRQLPTFVIPDFAKRIAMMERDNLEPVLKVGNLDVIRDFSDVRDIVRGYVSLMKLGKSGEVYNIGSGKGYAIKELLNKLLKQSNISIAIEPDPERLRPSDVPVLTCDNSKIKSHIGWVPEISIDQTILDVLNYWRNA